MSRHGLHTDPTEKITTLFQAPPGSGTEKITLFFQDPAKVDNTPKALHLANLPAQPQLSRPEKEVLKKKEDLYAKAYQEGYQRGFDQGRREGTESGMKIAIHNTTESAAASRKVELDSFFLALQRVLHSSNEAMAEWYRLAEEELGPIVADIAQRVVIDELKISRANILAIVKDAMSEITHASTARVRVNPFDSALMKSFEEEIKACAQSVKEIEIVDDPTIEGGCVIETEGGLVDARIENKIAVLTTELRKAA